MDFFYDQFLSQYVVDLCSEEMASKVKNMLLLCIYSCQVNQSYEMYAGYTKSMIDDYRSVFEHFNTCLKVQCSNSLVWYNFV